MTDPNTRRIVLMGKSGSGKSSLANSLFGASAFRVNHSSDSKSKLSQSQSRSVNDLRLTITDTPGIFSTRLSEQEVRCELFGCYAQTSPGPHALLYVLPVEKFTVQEQALVDRLALHFGDGIFKYTTVVFTHGDQLPERTQIGEFVGQSEGLSELVRKCGERCHVMDNKYWNNTRQDEYRSNTFQRKEILKSIERTFHANEQSFFTNEALTQVEVEIQKEQDRVHESEDDLSVDECREKAKQNLLQRYVTRQRQKHRLKHVFVFTGLSVFTYLFLSKCLSFLRCGTVSEAGASDAKDVVAPINNALLYITHALEAISNNTHME